MKTTELQDKLFAKLASLPCCGELTFAGSWWGRDGAERFYFADSARLTGSDSKPVKGVKVWLQFDSPSTLEGVSLRCQAPKRWLEVVLSQRHKAAVLAAIELVDPLQAAELRLELAAAEAAGESADMVGGEDD